MNDWIVFVKKILNNNIDNGSESNPAELTNISLNKTIRFRNFKIAFEEDILNCQIKNIIIPLLADYVVIEVNHFIRILQSLQI